MAYAAPQNVKEGLPRNVKVDEEAGKGGEWGVEGWEEAEVDRVFERFVKRVGAEGEQCVRSVFRFFLIAFSNNLCTW